tara:strand:+ start:31 stop:549 length:519 start_codon:yes stop_codon:yes gene_type:complete
MPNYNNGKIYKIINLENKVIYIGSTTEKLCKRFSNHKHRGNGNKIILLENCPCNSREELIKKEQEFIEQYDNLLNQLRAFNSEEYNKEYQKKQKKKYFEENKDKISEYRKVYYEENKDNKLEYQKVYREEHKVEISQKDKVKLVCECGCEIRKYDMNRHKKTKKHIKLMETK